VSTANPNVAFVVRGSLGFAVLTPTYASSAYGDIGAGLHDETPQAGGCHGRIC